MDLPVFRYHPDPVATGSAVSTDAPCSLCGIQRGIRYAGPVYGNQPDVLCLHCIASGEAAERLGWPAEQIEKFLPSLDRHGEPTAYLFRCLHCGTRLAYWDIG